MTRNRKRLALTVGSFTSAAFLLLAFRGLQPEQLWRSLADVSLPWLLIATLVYFVAVAVIALRWQFLLGAITAVPLAALVKLVFIGYMGNNVYPLRAGDALRVILLRRNHGVAFVRSTTIVAIERTIDGCVMLTFVFVGLLFIDLASREVDAMLSVTAPLFAALMLLALVLAAAPKLLRRVVSLTLRPLPERLATIAAQLAEEIIAGFAALRSPAHLLGAVVSSFVTWGIEAGAYWLVMRAFDLELNYAVALLLVGAVNLAGLIPASPGQVGVNEFVVISILTALGVPLSTATAYAILAHVVIWLPITIAGFALLIRQGLGWADIGRARDMQSAADPRLEGA